MNFTREFVRENGRGIGLCTIIALLAMLLSKMKILGFSMEIIGAPVFAIICGMCINLLLKGRTGRIKKGASFVSKRVLQWAVIMLGFSLNLAMALRVGAQSLPVIAATITASLVTAAVFKRVLGLDKNIACLIGVGSSVCGGSAIAATAPVIDADDEQVAQAISVIFLFNLLAALIFPVLGYSLGLGSEGFAIFAGTAVNDTSSVTSAALAAESIYKVQGILSQAVAVKLTRTLAIIPITLILSFAKGKSKKGKAQGVFPRFILYFIAASFITTALNVLPQPRLAEFYGKVFVPYAKLIARLFITMAMCAVGLNTDIRELAKKGKKPMLLGFLCWIAISLVSLAVQYFTGIYYTSIKF